MTTDAHPQALFKLIPSNRTRRRLPTMTRSAIAASAETHRATLAFVAEAGRASHSEEEDLHPARLDKAAAELDRALESAPLAREIAERDARDA